MNYEGEDQNLSKTKAATTEKPVIPRAIKGFCPWLIAKEVTTPAPKAAAIAASNKLCLERLYILGLECGLFAQPKPHQPTILVF